MRSSIIVSAMMATAIVFSGFDAAAAGRFASSRVRLLMHGSKDVGPAEFRAHFIPAGNLLGEVAPLMYLGAGITPADWIDIEPAVGWSFGPDEPIMSLRLAPSYGEFYGWMDVELQLPSKSGYFFAQVEAMLNDWSHFGFEVEGWGTYGDDKSWSRGFGPNLLFRLNKVGVDLACHHRGFGSVMLIEFVTRFHVFL